MPPMRDWFEAALEQAFGIERDFDGYLEPPVLYFCFGGLARLTAN
jgi:hypothetical protein